MALNIIHVSNLSLNGSWFERLLSTLEDRNYSQSLVTLTSEENKFSGARPKGVEVYSPRNSLKFFRYLQILVLINMAKSKEKQNFLFAQGHEEAIICSIAARILGIEFGLVHHVQPMFFPELMNRKRIKGFIHYELYKYYIRRATLIQSLSLDVTRSLERLGVPNIRIVPLPHGVNFEDFAQKVFQPYPLAKNTLSFPVILMVGRLSWEKNYPLALESFRELTAEFKQAKLLIAGIGPMDTELREMVCQFDLEQRVEFLGYVSNVPRLMVEADALLHLSLSESYGQVYIEASMVDLPIISFSVGIVQELKESSIPEILILDSKEPHVIARTISSLSKRVLSNRKKREYNPQQFTVHDERNVFLSIADYLEDFGQRSK
jgi:glycosyltransferase involved in cell wall biosynthesis